MNVFDKQRIENAIWTLEQYEYEIKQIVEEKGWYSGDNEQMFDILSDIKDYLM